MVYGELVHILDYYVRQIREYSRQQQLLQQAEEKEEEELRKIEKKRKEELRKLKENHRKFDKKQEEEEKRLLKKSTSSSPLKSWWAVFGWNTPPEARSIEEGSGWISGTLENEGHEKIHRSLSERQPKRAKFPIKAQLSSGNRKKSAENSDKYWEKFWNEKLLPTPADRNLLSDSMISSNGDSGICDEMPYIDDDDMMPIIVTARQMGNGFRRKPRFQSPKEFLLTWWTDTLAKKLHDFANEAIELIWKFFEVYVTNIVFIIIAYFIANNIYALYIPLAILLALAISLPSAADGIFSLLMCSYLFVVAIGKMIYQLKIIPELSRIDRGIGAENCSSSGNVSLAEWFGLKKEGETTMPFHMLFGVIVSVIALAFQSIVIYRQRQYRSSRGLPEPEKIKVFPDFHHSHYDRSLKHGLMFLVDYGFYKFGFEICIIAMGMDAWVRMDALGAIQCLWIIVFAINKRPVCRGMWYIYVVYMSILYPLQFIMYVGLPPDLCIGYPWARMIPFITQEANKNLNILLGLSTYQVEWPSNYLIMDFFVLLLSSCQLAVFRREGEDNDSIYSDGFYNIKTENPRYDFLDTKKSSIDYFKTLVFHYGHWITLVAALAAGIAGTSLFALGYIVLTLWLLWQGNSLYVMNARNHSFEKTLKSWNMLLLYTIMTITLKVVLQIFGCVFLGMFDSGHGTWRKVLCIIRQLFSIVCINKLTVDLPDVEDTCNVETKEAAIGYDVVALAFILFQRRIFHSWYFQHCMMEYRCEVILASRGAILKNQLIEKEMKEQYDQQKAKFNEIRRRTDAIRERYQKQIERGAAMALEPKTYGQESFVLDEDDPFPYYDLRTSRNECSLRYAKRAGDYYMFKYDPENDELVEPIESFVPEMDPKDIEYNRLDPGQIMYAATAHNLDLAKTVGQVKKGDLIKDPEDRAIEAISEPREATDRQSGGSEDETDGPNLQTKADEEGADKSKFENGIKFVQKMFASALDMCSVILNRLCREHRYVSYVLHKEKEKLKTKHGESLTNTSRKLTELRTDVDLPKLQLVHSETDVAKMENEATTDWMKKSSSVRFLNAAFNCIGAHTDILCYFLAIMTQAKTGGLITMPLPLMSLLWGNLSNPRPSKFFWVTMITYTEFVIVIKFICQFSFFPFNDPAYISDQSLNPLTLDKLFGVSKREYFALWDIMLLFALFFHRYMLRKLGLWKDANMTETFLKPDSTRIEGGKDNEGADVGVSEVTSTAVGSSSLQTAEEAQQAEEPQKGPIARFVEQLFNPKFRYVRDLYPIMFGIDVICFLIMTFGYSSFGEGGSGNVLDDVKASRIPVTLVVMLVGMTLAIIIDRALYLRKSVGGKLIYQVTMIGFLHVWIFMLLPEMTRRTALGNKVAQWLYIVKSCYLLVSAWQIRNGYPELCIGNLLTHSYGMINMIAFKIFMNIPFLFELRTTIDWTWTDTSMPLFDFFNMENFYAHIFNIKCARQFEAAYPAPRGVAKGKLVKYLMGFPIIIGVVVFIWSPLLLWSLLNQIGTISMPEKVTLRVSIEGYPALYAMEAQGRNHDNKELQLITPNQLAELNTALASRYTTRDGDSIIRSRNSVSYLKGYTFEDILMVRFRPESETYWPISNESVNAMIEKLSSADTHVNYEVQLEFTRPFDPNENTALKHSKSWLIPIPQNATIRNGIIASLKGGSHKPITIKNAIPAYIQVPNQGELNIPTAIGTSIIEDAPTGQFKETMDENEKKTAWFDTIHLKLNSQDAKVWVAEFEHPGNHSDPVWIPTDNTTYSERPYLQVVGFVDRAFPSFLAKIFKGGVIAMYASVIFIVGRGLVRGIFTISPSTVMFTEFPNADHLLKICLDIYLVREAKDFMLEQDLYAKLIFLFRSPATLIEWTRPSKRKIE